jgi:hypothetical protein
MRREESSANPEKQPGHDDANAEPGNGTAGPGDPGYEGVTNVGDEGANPDDAADRVTPDPAVQSDG